MTSELRRLPSDYYEIWQAEVKLCENYFRAQRIT